MGGRDEADLFALDPSPALRGADQGEGPPEPFEPGGSAGGEAGVDLGVGGRSQPQRGVVVENHAKISASVNADQGGEAKEENHEGEGGDSLVPGGTGSPKDTGEEHDANGHPEAGAGDPRPNTSWQPGGDDLVPTKIGRLQLRGLAGILKVLAGSAVQGINPEGLFPGEDGGAYLSTLPLGVAEVEKGTGGGSLSGSFAKRASGAGEVIGVIGVGAFGEGRRERGRGAGGGRAEPKQKGEAQT